MISCPFKRFLTNSDSVEFRMPLGSRGIFHWEINLSEYRVPWGQAKVLEVGPGTEDRRTASVPGCPPATLAPAELCISPAGTVPSRLAQAQPLPDHAPRLGYKRRAERGRPMLCTVWGFSLAIRSSSGFRGVRPWGPATAAAPCWGGGRAQALGALYNRGGPSLPGPMNL